MPCYIHEIVYVWQYGIEPGSVQGLDSACL